jgi:hypothetical protein
VQLGMALQFDSIGAYFSLSFFIGYFDHFHQFLIENGSKNGKNIDLSIRMQLGLDSPGIL